MSKEKILKAPERVKWFLWHGHVFRADETLTDLMFEVDGAIEEDREARRPVQLVLEKLARALEEFGTSYCRSESRRSMTIYGRASNAGIQMRGHSLHSTPQLPPTS
jgi:hypothetical protein